MTTLDRQLLDCMCTLAQASVAGHPWQPVLEDKTTSEWLEDPLLGGNDVHPLIIDEPTGQTQGPGLGPGLGLGLGPGPGPGPGVDDIIVLHYRKYLPFPLPLPLSTPLPLPETATMTNTQ